MKSLEENSSTTSRSTSSKSSNEIEYPTDSVTVNICGSLYQAWSAKKSLYKNSPMEGIKVDIEYADTLGTKDANGHEIDSSSPIAVCLHGAPGSHRDFKNLIKHMQGTGHRVIVPNFPTYKITTKTKVFRHSSLEKKEFVKSFLSAIQVKKIDVLVSHSSAIYPTVLLWRDEEAPEIRSFVFINPSGHRRIKAMKPKIVTSVFVRVYQNKLGRLVVRTFGRPVLAVTGCPVRPDNMDRVILSATTMVYSRFHQLRESLDQLREKKVPILMVISENDKLVDAEISHEMAQMLGASREHYAVYNQYSILEKERTCKSHPWVALLPEGGHYSFIHHPKVIDTEITQFLSSINNNQQEEADEEVTLSP